MRAVVYGVACRPTWRAAAARGGPGGEIGMASSLVRGLARLGVGVRTVGSLRAFALGRALDAPLRALGLPAPAYFVDAPALALARRYHILGTRSRVRLLEWFGRGPASARALGLAPAEVLLPYPDAKSGGTFLGYMLADAHGRPFADRAAIRAHLRATRARPRRRQGILWGKEARYFTGPVAELVRLLAAVCPLHACVSDERGHRPGLFTPGVTRHDALPPAAFRALLGESAFVLGVGDPVSGPTAIEALADGAALLLPRYRGPRALPGGTVVATQHPYAAAAAAPHVHLVDLDDPAAVVDLALRQLDRPRPSDADDDALAHHLAPLSSAAYLERLAELFAGF